jgi:hypothetical protein
VFQVGQLVEGNILTPKLVGSSVGLHPVWLIFALSAFGALFGFVGILVAVPVAAAIGVLVRYAIERYREGRLYRLGCVGLEGGPGRGRRCRRSGGLMAEQLVFDLPVRPAMGRDDFFVSGSNAGALAQVDGWRDWPFGKLVLVGPRVGQDPSGPCLGRADRGGIIAAARGGRGARSCEPTPRPRSWSRMPTAWRAMPGPRRGCFTFTTPCAARRAGPLHRARAARAMGPDACPIWTAACARRSWRGSRRRTMRFCRR